MYGPATIQTPGVVTNVSPNGTVTETPVVVTNTDQGMGMSMGAYGMNYGGGYPNNTGIAQASMTNNMTGGMVTQTNTMYTNNTCGYGVGYGMGAPNV